MDMIEEKRKYWIDFLKIIACLFVVVNHNLIYLFEYSGYNSFSHLFYSILMGIVKISIPLFLMITGYLLLSRNDNYEKIIKRIFRVLIPLVIMTIIYSFLYIEKGNITIFGVFKQFFKGPINASLWYLYALIGIYLCVPFIKRMIKGFKDKDYLFFLICFLILPSFIPIIEKEFSLEVSDFFVAGSFPLIVSYLVAGIYLTKIKLNKKYFFISILLFIVSTVFSIFYMYKPYLEMGILSYFYDSWNNLFTVLSGLSFFYIFRYVFENKNFNETLKNILGLGSNVSFGIYLIHVIISQLLFNSSFIKAIFLFNSYIGIVIFCIIAFVFSGALVYCLKQVPVVKKFL